MAGSRLGRRRFLQTAAVSGAAVTAVSCGGSPSPWRTLTRAEAATLAALCDQIIPPDQDPGATAAGALEFLDRQLSGRYKRHRTLYREGLASLNELAAAAGAGPFERLTSPQQFNLLERIESGQTGKGTAAAKLFPLAIAHVLQGYYGPPRHGGNRDAVSWKMVGLPARQTRGRTAESKA